MSSIDERIVSMEFNNKQFEAGVSQTTKSLEKLRSGLKLDNAGQGLAALQRISDRFSLSNVGAGIDSIASKFNSLGVIGFSVLNRLTNGVINMGVGMVTSLLDPIVQGGSRRALNIEQAKFMFKGLGMDVEATMASAREAVLGTAYGLDAAASAAAQFGASGMRAGADMTSALKAISGVAAMTSSSYEDIANVFTKVAGQGRLMGDDLLSLSSRGINAAATLAKALNRTEAEVRDMVTKGQIDFKTFYTATDNAFGEHATKANETYTGSLSNMRAALARIGASVATPAFEKQRDIFNAMTPVIDKVNKALDPLYGWLTKLMSLGSQNIVGFLNELKLDGLGISIRQVTDGLDKVRQFIVNITRPIGQAFNDIFPINFLQTLSKIATAFQGFANGLKVSTVQSENIRRTLRGLFAILDIGWMIISGLFSAVGRLFGAVNLGSSDILKITARFGDWLVSVRDAIKEGEGISKFFAGLGSVLAVPIDLINRLWKNIAGVLQDADSLTNLNFDSIGEFFGKLAKRFEPLIDFFKSVGYWIMQVTASIRKFFEPILGAIGDRIKDLQGTIFKALKNVTFDQVIDLINAGLFGALLAVVNNGMNDIRSVFGAEGSLMSTIKGFFGKKEEVQAAGGGIMDSIKGIFTGLQDVLGEFQNSIKANTLLKIAIALAILTASIVALSLIDSVKLASALGAMTIMFSQLFGAMAIFDKIVAKGTFTKMPAAAGSLLLLAGAMLVLSTSVLILSNIPWDRMLTGIGGLGLMLGIVLGAMKLLTKNLAGFSAAAFSMVILATAISILVTSVSKLSNLGWFDMLIGIGGVAALLGVLIGFTRTMGNPVRLITTAIAIMVLGTALNILAKAVGQFAQMSLEQIAVGLGAVAASLFIISMAMASMGDNKRMILNAAALVIMGYAIGLLADAIVKMAGISFDQLGVALIGLAGALLIMTGVLNIVSKNVAGALALVVVAGALNLIVGALMQLSTLSWDNIGPGLVMLGASLAILAGAMALMGIPLVLLGAVGLLAASAAMLMLVPALQMLSTITWDTIGEGLGILAASLGILAGMGLLLIPASVAFLAMGLALVFFGAGIMMASVGIAGLAVGLGALAAVAALGAGALKMMIQTIIQMIPEFMAKLGEGIIAFANVISQSGPTLVAAFVTMLTSLITSIAEVVPLIVDTIVMLILKLVEGINQIAPPLIDAAVMLITKLVAALVVLIPLLIDAGLKIITGLLTGIANNIGPIIEQGTNVIVNFLDGMGKALPRILQAGIDLVLDFLHGIATAIRDNAEKFRAAGLDIASAIIEGITGGISGSVKTVVDTAINLGNSIFDGVMGALDAHSPSRKMILAARYAVDGIVVGLKKFGGAAKTASGVVGKGVVDEMSDTIGRVSDIVSKEVNMNPVIRPVLDISDLQKKATMVNGMFAAQTISADATYARASSFAVEERAERQRVQTDADGRMTGSEGTTIELTQINNSPKALGTPEIYRKTQNLLSQVKEGLEDK